MATKTAADTSSGETRAFVLTIDDEAPQPVELVADSAWDVPTSRSVRIVPAGEDTTGESLATTIDVVVFGDDVEGQALTLRFPNPADAAQFQRKLLLAGALAGTMAAASIGASAALHQVSVSGAGAVNPASVVTSAAYVHDTDKLVYAAPRDTDKLVAVPPRDTDKLNVAAPEGAARIGQPASEFGLGAAAARAEAATGQEVQARATAASAGGSSLGASADTAAPQTPRAPGVGRE
jgi:hypothetical protein